MWTRFVGWTMNRVRRHRRDLRQRIADYFHPPGICPTCDLPTTDCACCPWCPGSGDRHAMSCPVELGIFPVDRTMETAGFLCVDCDTPFHVGDSYGYARDAADPEIVSLVCLGCIARSELGLNRG